MISRLKILSFPVFLFFCGIASAQISVEIQLVNENLEIFFINDFDINSPASGPELFRIFIDNQNSEPCQVQLSFSVRSERFGELSSGTTDPFDLNPGPLLPPITNRDLFSSTGPYRLVEYDLGSAAKDLLNSILATGKLPSDTYDFKVEVVNITCATGTGDSDNFQLVITNPNTLDLVFPGSPASGREEDCYEIFTSLPQFQWESDIRKFTVIIAEAREGEDPESVLNQEPRFVRKFVVGNLGTAGGFSEPSADYIPIPSTSFQFPSSGEILTLRPGKTYFWQVIGIIESSSGPIELKSEIWCFRIAEVQKMRPGSEQETILKNLLSSLGIDVDRLFGEGGALEGYHATIISYNGKQITFAELLSKINELRSKFSKYKIEE